LIIKGFNLESAPSIATPLPSSVKYTTQDSPTSKEEINEMCRVPYLQALSSIMYAMVCSCLDIANAVGVLSHFGSNPGHAHWHGLKHVLHHLKGTAHLSLAYGGPSNMPVLSGFTDANWAGDPDTCCSFSGYVFLLNGTAITWSSKKQLTVVMSTVEALVRIYSTKALSSHTMRVQNWMLYTYSAKAL
jgi:hypothetical protein